ncbi:marine proteobacterial sortase target protein [Marinobacter fuscus]|uniref:Marine proteobacterial sortase target protein n=1 Tax=Marinobacter fuscus TaxID=2109942 RepID=A0A2T1K4T7_9GAMM|nr:marine proteobacterial sortase target protein [Marinobacter fuscus]PSF05095.1 marine proteobacterial sortase target protein [Marinobacter fuscus]
MMLLSLRAAPSTRPPTPVSRPVRGLSRLARFSWLRCAEGISLWLAMVLMLFVHPMYAEAGPLEAEQPGQLYLIDHKSAWQEPALVLDSRFQVSVSGLLAQTRLTRTFRNTSDRWQEGIFVFPLPGQAAVYGLTMTVGERRIEGEIQPRAQARTTYQQARESGRKAATVEQNRPNLFTSRIANIPPGEAVTVELRYQQPVAYRRGEFELRLPTTLTPRYMPGTPVSSPAGSWQAGWSVPTRQVPDAPEISPFTVLAEDVNANSHRARIELEIDAGFALAGVSSPSHRLQVSVDGSRAMVQPEAGPVLMDRDVIVRWQPVASQAPMAALFHQQWQGEDFMMAMVLPPATTGPVLRRELVFVIDTSGSMAGESIRQARSALLRGLDTLRPGDRFNIIEFNSEAHALFMQPVPVDSRVLARARRYVQALDASGGTEMASALSLALAGQAPSDTGNGLVRQMVFITDGAVGNESALFDQIRSGLGNRRLFTVAIGSAPNTHFLREAARWGRGQYTAIQSTAEVDQSLGALFAAMEAPVMTDLEVVWPVGTADAEPARPGDLFQDQPLIQVVRGVAPLGEVAVSGQLPGGRRWQTRLDLASAAPGQGLDRQWARGRMDALMDHARLAGEQPDEQGIVELSVRHKVMSPFTSFVAVEKTPSRPEHSALDQERLPTLLPAGSDAGMLRYPQTATLAPLLTALGLLGLMFALAMAMLSRRGV